MADRTAEVEARIRARVAERADDWFPGTGARPPVHLRRLADRPRAVLYAVSIGGASRRPQILAKVRRGWPGSESREPVDGRPRLVASTLPVREQTALEFAALTAIREMCESSDGAFGAVRPLDHLVDEDTVLMEYVDAETLRSVLVRRSRLSPQRLLAPRDASTAHVWHGAGSWLRAFQAHMPRSGVPARQATRDEVVERLCAYGAFLTASTGHRAVADLVRRGADLARQVLPEHPSLAVGHGDYAPRNVFVLGDGRLAVFDPLPRWAVPRFEDLCRFLVALRLQGLQLHTHGLAYGRRELDRREQQVIDGYRGEEQLSMPELRCFQLLITLDKWSALVDGSSGGVKGRLRGASVAAATGFLGREAGRVLERGESEAG